MQIYQAKRLPPKLKRIPSPPKQLFWAGKPLHTLLKRPSIAIVGSRKLSLYGQHVTLQLASQLAEQGIIIVSGLALGVDGLAHRGALEVAGHTIAVLPGPLEAISPAAHQQLAKRIVGQGGTLVSEYAAGEPALKPHFIARNRLVAGLADAVLITEAGEQSGSLHTARFAIEQGKPVLVVPGNITSLTSVGTNNLLKSGARAVTSYLNVLEVLGLEAHAQPAPHIHSDNPDEQRLLELLLQGVMDGEQLLKQSQLAIAEFNQTLSRLEIAGHIRPLGGNQWALC